MHLASGHSSIPWCTKLFPGLRLPCAPARGTAPPRPAPWQGSARAEYLFSLTFRGSGAISQCGHSAPMSPCCRHRFDLKPSSPVALFRALSGRGFGGCAIKPAFIRTDQNRSLGSHAGTDRPPRHLEPGPSPARGVALATRRLTPDLAPATRRASSGRKRTFDEAPRDRPRAPDTRPRPDGWGPRKMPGAQAARCPVAHSATGNAQ